MFDYVLDKVREAPFQETPFRHIEINDLFSDEHFSEITAAQEIALPPATDDRALVASLDKTGWEPIPFGGATRNVEKYLRWHQSRKQGSKTDTTEGFGLIYRMFEPQSEVTAKLQDFLKSDAFRSVCLEKFGIDGDEVTVDTGIQKYLDGYEISPHTDMRRKALTFLGNINPAVDSESQGYHTQYMTFRPERAYIETFWRHNPGAERSWVPWNWAETVKQQTRNNSIVFFAPSSDTLHAIRASYDHLGAQRTQLYGNFWYREEAAIETKPEWQDLVISGSAGKTLKQRVPDFVKKPIRALRERRSDRVGQRAIQ